MRNTIHYPRPYEILAAMRKAFPQWHIMMRQVTSGEWYETVFEIYVSGSQQTAYGMRGKCYDFLDGICPGMSSSIYVRIISVCGRPSDIPYEGTKRYFIPTLCKSDMALADSCLDNTGFTCTKDELLFFIAAHDGIYSRETAGLGLHRLVLQTRTAQLRQVDKIDGKHTMIMALPPGKDLSYEEQTISMNIDADNMWFEFNDIQEGLYGAVVRRTMQSIVLDVNKTSNLLKSEETQEDLCRN